jgi:hypothetical protein
LKTDLAASRTRSRFRTASARGLLAVLPEQSSILLAFSIFFAFSPLQNGGTLHIIFAVSTDAGHTR